MLAALLSSRRFLPLFLSQFFSAFNDNFVKQTLVILVTFGVGVTAPSGNAPVLVAIAGAFLVLPGFILSGLAGEIADKFDKSKVAERVKLYEIPVVVIGALGFYLHSWQLLLLCVLGLGIMGTLFGPVKYGLLPDQLDREELPAGNALVEGGTFLAILTGLIAAEFGANYVPEWFVAIIMVAMAVLCWLSAREIPPVGAKAPDIAIDRNLARSSMSLIAILRADPRLWNTSLAVAWFWAIGIVVVSMMPGLAKDTFGADHTVNTFFIATFSIGIALGSLLAVRLVAGRIILVLSPIALVLMGVVGIHAAWVIGHAQPAATPQTLIDFLRTLQGMQLTIDFVLLAMFSGLLIVPAFAAVQDWAPKSERARVIGGVNIISALFMTIGAGLLALMQAIGVGAGLITLLIAVLNIVAGIFLFRALPINPLRDIILLMYRALFRLEVHGIENLDTKTPNRIIAVNHVSFLDAGLILALLDKDPVFAIDHTIAKAWWVKPFLKICRSYPLDPSKPMATRALINAVKAGETLVIFPEGRLTVTGALMKIYDGAGLIADKSDAEIVPVRLDGLDRSRFTRLTAVQANRSWFPKVVVTFTEPVKLAIDPELRGRKRRQAAGAALYDVMSDLIYKTTPIDRSLFEAFVAASQRYKRRIALEDPISGQLTYGKALIGISVLARKFEEFTKRDECVGVLLPNANAVALTFFALQSIGRVPAMLNYTAGAANLVSACTTAEVKTILCSRAFVERARLHTVVAELGRTYRFIWLEDVRAGVSTFDKLRAMLAAGQTRHQPKPDDTAAILFTSGSEGTPKGVALSHRNILANCAQVAARIDFGPGDILLNVLPVFHSFGLTGGMVLPLISGVRAYLYPSPLHYRIIPELVYGINATILFGTDTFLSGYARAAHPYDFRSLRYVIAGAEPVKVETRRAYNEKFGLRILEGYGVTETAPIIAVNTPMFNRNGTVGRILPEIETRLETVPGIEEGGRLFVQGANVMKGYVLADKPGVIQPPEGGWHDTGDIVTIDPQGFVTIRGRAKRFAKIAGEMVSLAAAENQLADLWPDSPLAIVAVPDARKGEKLIAYTTHTGATRSDMAAHLRAKHAPELMAPAEVVVVDALPVLGTGKTDYVTLNKLGRDHAEASRG